MLDSKCLPIPMKSCVTQLLHFYVLLLQTNIKFIPSLRINSFVADSQFRIYCRQPHHVVSWILCMNTLHWNTPETALTAPPPPSPPHPKVAKNVSISNASYLSDSTHSLSQSRQCLCADDLDMMSHAYRYVPSVMVWHYCGHIPTLYCCTTYCAHWHNWIV